MYPDVENCGVLRREVRAPKVSDLLLHKHNYRAVGFLVIDPNDLSTLFIFESSLFYGPVTYIHLYISLLYLL